MKKETSDNSLVLLLKAFEGFEGFEAEAKPSKAFKGVLKGFEEASQHCVLKVCFSIFKFILFFFVLTPLKRFRLTSSSFVQRKHAFEAFEGLRVEEGGGGGDAEEEEAFEGFEGFEGKDEGFEASFEAFRRLRSLRGRGRRDFRSLRSPLSKPSKASKGASKPSSSPSKLSKASSKFVSIFKFILFFFVLTPLKRFRLDFFFFCAEKACVRSLRRSKGRRGGEGGGAEGTFEEGPPL